MTKIFDLAAHESVIPLKIGSSLSYQDLMSSYSERTYSDVAERLMQNFGLILYASGEFEFGIKALIKGREFSYAPSISAPTKIFMLLHTLGHYQFITRAAQRGINSYDYIYETSEHGEAHVYRYREATAAETVVTQKILNDRIEFEVRANDFAVTTAARLGFNMLIPLVRLYEPADIRYIIDVMEGGPPAIVSDRDYIEQYVLSGIGVHQQSNQERIFDSDLYTLDGIDWGLIAEKKIEIHFL